MTVLDFVILYTECSEGDVQIISNTSELLTSNKTGRVMGPKCIHKMIAKHPRIIWLDKRHWWWLRHDDLSLKMAIPSSQTIHACFVVTFHTQASPRFVTGEFASELQEHTGCGFYQICFNKMALTQTLAGWYSSPKPSSFCVIVIYFNLASSLVTPLAGIKQKKIINKKKPEQVKRTASLRISLNHSPLCASGSFFDSPKSLRLLWESGQILYVYKHKNGYW